MASEFYSTLMQRNTFIEFDEIMDKLEKKFGKVPQPDTA
jgi:hypothetical protein